MRAEPAHEQHTPGLLDGFVLCGRCGGQMRLAASAPRRYLCQLGAANSGTCPAVEGAILEHVTVTAFLAAFEPAELDRLIALIPPTNSTSARIEPATLQHLRQLSWQVPAAWHTQQLTMSQQRALLHTVIWRVLVLGSYEAAVQVKIVWLSGAITPLVLR